MSASLTQDLARFIAALRYDDIPGEAVEIVRTGFIDCIGVMAVGQTEPGPGIILRTLKAAKEAPESRLFLTDQRISAPLAALVNGTASHVLDYDDVAMPLGGHPSTVLVPAILAEADALADITGKDLITAYVAGYETWAELIARDKNPHHAKGWHPTSIFGVIAAAASCAVLHKLDAPKTGNALAIAASEACGVIANFGSMTKSFHAGRAAQSAVVATRLAAAGMDGAPDALEHHGGFLSAVSPAGNTDRETPASGLGKYWKILEYRLDVKKYPMCYCVHRALDAVLDLLAAHPVDAGDVVRIEPRIGKLASEILRNHRPQTGLEAKFSIEFAMASAVIAQRAGLAQLSDGFVRRPDVQEMMGKVVIVTTDEIEREGAIFPPYDQITLHLADGSTLVSEKVAKARGDATLPLSRAETWAKFEDCLTTAGYSTTAAMALFESLEALEALPSMAALPSLTSLTPVAQRA